MPMKRINEVNLFYDEIGEGEPIIFHHGYTGAHDVWLDEIGPRLQHKYRCIVMDCRGAGDSEQPAEGYNIGQYARDVVGLADDLGLEKFTYVGHSMGGGIGYQLAVAHAQVDSGCTDSRGGYSGHRCYAASGYGAEKVD